MKKRAAGMAVLALLPFAGMCFSVAVWDRVYPMVLGLPFNFFWLLAWICLTSVCLVGIYALNAARTRQTAADREQDTGPR